jgi:sugar lactone lactonase YvrE
MCSASVGSAACWPLGWSSHCGVRPAALAGQPGVIIDYAGNGSYAPPTPGPATSSALGYLNGVAVDAAGNVYIADVSHSEVEKVTPAGTLSVIAGTGTAGTPTPGPATSSMLNRETAVAVDFAGDVYIADTNNSEVEKVTPAGTLSVIAGTGTAGAPTPGPATSSQLNSPQGVAVDSGGDLYVADGGNNEVEKVTPAGTLSVIAGTGTAGAPTPGPATSSRLNNPQGVAVDSAGDLYIADAGNSDVEKVVPAGTLAVIAGTGTFGQASYGGPATSSALYYAQGVAVDSAGDVYVADTDQFTIGMVSPAVPSNSTMPQVTGTAAVGQTLSASTGAWSPTPTGYGYEWQDCDSAGNGCVTVTGATASTYVLTPADIAHTIRALVTAGDSSGSASAASAPTPLVPAPTTTTTTTTPTTTSTVTPAPVVTPGFPEPTGRLTSRSLGRVELGMTRAQARGLYPDASAQGKRYEEFFSLAGGKVRVGYASPRLLKTLPATERRALTGRVVLALTANPYYSVRGIRPGTSLRTAAKVLHPSAVFHVGLNDWYMAHDGSSTTVLKVRAGTIQEIGVAGIPLTTRRAERAFITSFS